MGNKSSSTQAQSVGAATTPGTTPGANGVKTLDHDEQFQRNPKRRRIDNDYDGFPLFEDHGNATRALRIEVLKIFHQDSTRFKNGIMNGLVAPNVKDIAHVKARCKLTISSRQAGESVVLHVDSQVCDLKIFKNPASSSPMVRFASIKPFHIPEDKIYLERDDDAVFGLAKSYTVLIELESAGDPNWPPLDLVSSASDDDAFFNRTLPPRQWVLTASIADIFNSRHRKEIHLKVRKQPIQDSSYYQDLATNFRIDVDVRWLTPISSQLMMRAHDKDVQQSITVFGPNEPLQPIVNGSVHVNASVSVSVATNGTHAVNGANGVISPNQNPLESPPIPDAEKLVNGLTNGAQQDLLEDGAEGELTPSRSRRTRQEVNYNVKQMWNTAIGKETRKRRRMEEDNDQVDEHTITYLLPPEQVQTERFGCLICGAENDRLNQLRAHYMSHPQYEFHFDFRPKGGCFVSVTASVSDPAPLRPRVYQLGLPVKPLDLDRYVEGDFSWVNSRLGPDDGRDVSTRFPHARAPKVSNTTQTGSIDE